MNTQTPLLGSPPGHHPRTSGLCLPAPPLLPRSRPGMFPGLPGETGPALLPPQARAGLLGSPRKGDHPMIQLAPAGIGAHLGLPFPKDPMAPPMVGGPMAPLIPYDAMSMYPYGYGGLDARRKNATRESTNTLKAWLYEHKKNPYPTKGEKIMLAIITKMTLTQVSTWFANARRRLKKENKMTWCESGRDSDDSDREEGSEDRKEEDVSLDLDDDIDVENTDDESDEVTPTSHHNPSSQYINPVTSSSIPSQYLHQSPVPPLPPAIPLPPAPSSNSASSLSPASSSSSSSDNAPASSTNRNEGTDHGIKPKIWSLADMASTDNNKADKSLEYIENFTKNLGGHQLPYEKQDTTASAFGLHHVEKSSNSAFSLVMRDRTLQYQRDLCKPYFPYGLPTREYPLGQSMQSSIYPKGVPSASSTSPCKPSGFSLSPR